eukprot:TRINITY_DN56121_c0_g1_i1.p1 TRINITY_DN56121_c0_g1~~TRINITY_DN56121_c0_g1_i1.p1  ORF type:complete len:1105 (+),score=189.32 TRINITY_DN56121_c0_g1_i1:86-3400(+)
MMSRTPTKAGSNFGSSVRSPPTGGSGGSSMRSNSSRNSSPALHSDGILSPKDLPRKPAVPRFTTSTASSNNKQTTNTRQTDIFMSPPKKSVGHRSDGECENVVVAVRVRRFIPRELDVGAEAAILMREKTTQLTMKDGEKKLFSYDHCFWSHSDDDAECPYVDQLGVYNAIGVNVVENALKGFNSTIFAYGQTGSGKTYSMFGPDGSCGTDQEGLIPRVARDLFDRLEGSCADGRNITYKAEVHMVEIYCETVFDLLDGRKKLMIRGSVDSGFYLPNMQKFEVHNYREIEQIMRRGQMERTRAHTEQNEHSSRAHTLFGIEVKQISKENITTASVISLVDLAGSERLKLSGVEGHHVTESQFINKSLLNLGNCIEKIVEKSKNPNSRATVPFRDSALTKLLKESLGGNSKTILLVAISPTDSDLQQTLGALRFADRAKQIKTHAVINDAVKDARMAHELLQQQYAARIQQLQEECRIESRDVELREKEIELEAESMRLMKERENLKKERETNRHISDVEKRRVEEKEAELDAKLSQVQRTQQETMKKRQDLDREIAVVLSEREDQRKRRETEEQERLDLMDKLQQLQDENAKLQSKFQTVDAELTSVKESLNEKETTWKQQEATLKLNLERETESHNRIRDLQAKQLKYDSEQAENELKTEISRLGNEVSVLQRQLDQEKINYQEEHKKHEERFDASLRGMQSKHDQRLRVELGLKEDNEKKLKEELRKLQVRLENQETFNWRSLLHVKEDYNMRLLQMHASFVDALRDVKEKYAEDVVAQQIRHSKELSDKEHSFEDQMKQAQAGLHSHYNSRLDQQQAEKSSEVSNLEAKIEDMVAKHKQQIAAMESERESEREQASQLRQQMSRDQAEEIGKIMEDQKVKRQGLRQQSEDLEDQIAQLTTENADLKQKVVIKNKTMEEQAEMHSNQLSKLRNECEEARQQALDEQTTKHAHAVNTLKQQINALSQDRARIVAQANHNSAAMKEEAEKKIACLEEERCRLQTQLKALEQSFQNVMTVAQNSLQQYNSQFYHNPNHPVGVAAAPMQTDTCKYAPAGFQPPLQQTARENVIVNKENTPPPMKKQPPTPATPTTPVAQVVSNVST